MLLLFTIKVLQLGSSSVSFVLLAFTQGVLTFMRQRGACLKGGLDMRRRPTASCNLTLAI